MIIVIDALNRHLFSDVLAEMHALRARVFAGRLGWEVNVKNGMEIDQFDALNPAHVVCLDDDGDVVGCMRLLQTTGPHMLADVFYNILDGEPPLRSARIWEATRFCVDTEKLKGTTKNNSISYVTSEVMIGAFEYAQQAGVLDAIAVIDPVMDRVMKRSRNAPYDYLGSAKQMGKVRAMAALMDCSDERIEGIRDFAGITQNVFATNEEALALFNSGVHTHAHHMAGIALESAYDFDPQPTATRKPTLEELRLYCEDQIASATSKADKAAAHALKLELSALLTTGTPKRCDA
ncbi:acyl-homoserine-lactone synthase [Thalassovita sp.]|uniref:acyl-homoserine-lactone synthase n=1 Tax=Thalassovita sp. TaxID=1979401 RepID=UPI002B274B44|nr:acyl-homoserine-lactone synthase [Thalassovita sp.]